MESWSYVSGERGFVSEDSVTASDDIAGLGSSSQEAIENMRILDMGFHHTMRKAVSNNSIKDALGTKLSGVRMINSPPENAFWGEAESNSKLSTSVVEFNGADSSLFDLKLGRFDDQRDAHKLSASRVALNMYSTDSSKRIRVGGLNSLTPYCQVFGCKKDLSSSKDYHKRHKVCEVHSKTPKVIVNGIEQRFCQQCSRFHLLFEFDDGKRSCRKRLAGHNERRRKPYTGINSGRSGRLYQTYNSGSALSRFQKIAVSASSLDHQNVLSGCLSQQQKYARNDWSRDIKREQGANYSSQSAITVARGGLHSRFPFPSYEFDKNCPSIEKSGVYDILESKSNENSNLFRNASLGGDAFPGYDSSLTVQALSEFSDSGRALSLLSPQSQTSLSHTSGILMAYPMIIPGSHEHYNVTQISEKLLGMSPQASNIDLPNKFISSGINSVDNHLSQMITTSGSNAVVNYGIDGMFHGSDYMNGGKEHFSCEDGPTIDLLQLSSQLQRVEDQRQSLHKKPVNDSFL